MACTQYLNPYLTIDFDGFLKSNICPRCQLCNIWTGSDPERLQNGNLCFLYPYAWNITTSNKLYTLKGTGP